MKQHTVETDGEKTGKLPDQQIVDHIDGIPVNSKGQVVKKKEVIVDHVIKDGRGKSAGTKANLENYQWVKGESGNPSGRPLKNKWFRKAMREFGGNKPFSELARAWSDSDATAETNRDDLVQGIWKDVTGNDASKKYKALSLMLKYDIIEPIEPETS